MSGLQKWGGVASIINGGTYIFGFVLLFAVMMPKGYGVEGGDAATAVGFIVENTAIMKLWNLVIYVLNGLMLVVLSAALANRLKRETEGLAQVSMLFGLLWATLVLGAGMLANVSIDEVVRVYATDPEGAVSMWRILSIVENGIGGGNEIAGGTWALVLGLAMLRSTTMPKLLAYFSLIIGVSGLATILPGLAEIGGVIFGLGFIGWFIWTGVVLIRRPV